MGKTLHNKWDKKDAAYFRKLRHTRELKMFEPLNFDSDPGVPLNNREKKDDVEDILG